MSTIINATTTNGVVIQPDNSGSLQLATNSGTTALTIDTSQRAAFVAGTAALPAITTTGDTNTGIFFPAADTIAFAEGGAESMRINSSGNVGIGVTPSAWTTSLSLKALQISSASSLMGLNAEIGNQQTNITTNAYFDGANWKYISSDAALLYTQNTANLHQWFNASSGTAGNTVTFSERMRIDSSGNVLVGKTALPSSSVYGFAINASSNNFQYLMNSVGTTGGGTHFEFYNPNGKVGNINTSGSGTSYVTTSDYRLKENVTPMTGALDKIAQLKPVTYTWKIDGSDGQGFIAHELQAIVPDAVVGEKDAVDKDGNIKPQGIDTSFLVATLTAAIQEQQTIINDLKARVETLEAK